MSDILLITPPFTQLNTPYPATAYIKGFLNTKGIESKQVDLSLEVILKLLSRDGLEQVFLLASKNIGQASDNATRIFYSRHHYIKTIDIVLRFLQGRQPTLAHQIVARGFLPEASRFQSVWEESSEFGSMGITDFAKHLATLYLEDISDFIVECVDEDFGFTRYAERISRSANSFDDLYSKLQDQASFIDGMMELKLQEHMESVQPSLVCLTAPFPGNVYSALKCGQYIKSHFPDTKIALGGGFANTELRSLKDTRIFEFVDFISLDDGELPLELIIDYIKQSQSDPIIPLILKRTYHLDEGEVYYNNLSLRPDYKMADVGTPDYSDLLLDRYISFIEVANPMHKLWSDGRWNKLTMAHGCYWGKCTFCDISLDYIQSYEPVHAATLVDRVEQMIEQTGESGFHFVDEAAPPSLMKAFALEVLKRDLQVTWWANIRFEQSFTSDLCRLLKASGCIAVSGGLEVASNRLLELIQKGVSVEQVASVTHNFAQSGIMVHAYLMYGFPSQTIQETIDSLEMVRQMMELGIIHSGFWHQFALTAHSPVGLDPAAYGIHPQLETIQFAHNDIQFTDSTGIDHDLFADGLKTSLYNYMHGVGFEIPLGDWFEEVDVPDTQIAPHYIESSIYQERLKDTTRPNHRVLFIGQLPQLICREGSCDLVFYSMDESFSISIDLNHSESWFEILNSLQATQSKVSYQQLLKRLDRINGDHSLNKEYIALLREGESLVVV